jgi:glutathione S-transferase
MTRPVLYSFRRCPYAMRARLAIASANVQVELREILLRDKASEFLAVSPSATVPCLADGDTVIDESRDIMVWALQQNDPEDWLQMPTEGWDIIDDIDGPFKTALDRYKYTSRYEAADKDAERSKASESLIDLNDRLKSQDFLFGASPKIADMATLPFVRQFANTDKQWFDAQDWTHLSQWVESFLASERFLSIMAKYPVWKAGDPTTVFPETNLAP